MFADIGTARAVLEDYFNEPGVELLISLLQPVIVFEPLEKDGAPKLGATRIGGTPDLPHGQPWPVRSVPSDAAAIAARGGNAHGDHLRKHLVQALPLQFAAQVDLAEAVSLGDVAVDLPNEGRLLFFYDSPVGPWHNGTETCRVIWDTTPAASLQHAPLPQPLIDLHAEAEGKPDAADTRASAVSAATPSLYWGPPRAMRLGAVLRPPDALTVEGRNNHELVEALEDEDFEASYVALFDDHLFGKSGAPPRHQLLGSPLPDQDDPRMSAVVWTEFGVQHLSLEAWRENTPRIAEAAADWLLLFQLDQKDYLQQRFAEGMVYFLIRRADLAARAFDRVVAVYQQT